MKPEQIQSFVMRYLEAEGCHIIEKGLAHATVKLSPAADKALTGRTFYWSFVERTGTPAETMTFTFVFDPEKHAAETAKQQPPGGPGGPGGAGQAPAQDTILGRYFGYAPPAASGRIPKEELTFGSRRLEQIFTSVRAKGRFVRLFEEPPAPMYGHEHGHGHGTGYVQPRNPPPPLGCTTWLHINYKAELACDMKRDELHSLGIDLITGEIVEDFYQRVRKLPLTPRLPANLHLQSANCTLQRASVLLDSYLEKKLLQYDHTWAHEASLRLTDELDRIHGYYADLLATPDEDKRLEIEGQYRRRQEELEWQYAPRVGVSVVSCGLFHLLSAKPGAM